MENTLKDDYKSLTLAKIKKLKLGSFGRTFIKCVYTDLWFEIILLTSDCAKSQDLMELLGRWRKENEGWYLSQFPVSTKRTRRWFIDKLIEVPDRMLFIIKISGKYVGHVGLFGFDFEKRTCEIDNILRGEKDFPGIMGCAVSGMMDWGKRNLELRGYTLKVLSDNLRAIRFYHKLGYHETSRIPLIQVNGRDGLEWAEAPPDYEGEATRYYVVMGSA